MTDTWGDNDALENNLSAGGDWGVDDEIDGAESGKKGSGLVRRVVGDSAVSLAKGVVGAGEAAVGLGDLISGGKVGKAMQDDIGYDPARAKGMLDELYSPEQRLANQKVADADGFVDTAMASLENPSVIPQTVIESVPSMLGGGAIAKGAIKLAPKIAPWAAGALGEGVTGAGMAAEGTRQQTEDGELTAKQAALSAASGVGTGILGAVGGRLSKALGITDVDTAIAQGALQAGEEGASRLGNMAKGFLSEGLLQEVPQSVQEQALQNAALDKPLDEGLGNSAAMGLLSGGVMGAGANIMHGKPMVQPTPTPENPNPAPVPRPDPNAGPLSRAAALLPAPSVEPGTLYADGQGNVGTSGQTGNRAPAPGFGGSGIDQQAPIRSSLTGELMPAEEQPLSLDPERETNTYENTAPKAIADGRRDGVIVDSKGNAVPGKLPNTKPADYVQGGRGMDQQAVVGKRFSNPVAAKNAISKAATPGVLEAVKLPSGEFEVRQIAVQAEPTAEVVATAKQEVATAKPAGSLSVRFGNQTFPVESIEDAQTKWRAFRDETNAGNSEIGNGIEVFGADGKQVARISYNGRAWDTNDQEIKPAIKADQATVSPETVTAPTTVVEASTQPKSLTDHVAKLKEAQRRIAAPSKELRAEAESEGVDNVDWYKNTEALEYAIKKAKEGAQSSETNPSSVTDIPITVTDSGIASGTGALPDILTQNKKFTVAKMAKAAGVKKGSPGYEQAIGRVEADYESQVDDALAALPFEQFNAHPLNSESPESANRQAWTQMREERDLPVDTATKAEPAPAASPKAAQTPAPKAKPAGARKKVNGDTDTLIQAIARLGGISMNYREDTIAEAKGNRMVPGVGALFSKNGTSIDDMAMLLDQHNYIPPAEMDNLGGVPWLQEAVRAEFDGRKTHYAIGSKAEEAAFDQKAMDDLEAQLANAEEDDGWESMEVVKSDLLDDIDLAEIRQAAHQQHADELDAIFEGRSDEENGNSTKANSPAAQEAGGNTGRNEQAGGGQQAQDGNADAGRESDPEAFSLTTQSEDEIAEKESREQAALDKAAEDKRIADAARDNFDLSQGAAVVSASNAPTGPKQQAGDLLSDRPMTRGEKKAADEAKAKAEKPAVKSEAPEHEQVGVDDRELAEIVEEFNAAQEEMRDNGVHEVFAQTKKSEIVRLADKAKVYHAEHGWMTVKEAKALVDSWEEHAVAQGRDEKSRSLNGDKIVLSLFDKSGTWSLPWEQAGYQVFRFDIQDSDTYEDPETGEERKVGDINNMSVEYFSDLFGDFEGKDIHAILAACPCTDFASSGARHFAAKDADGRTVASVNLVHQTLRAIEYFKPAIWALENPVGRIEKLGGLPNWRLAFDPNHLGDPYTKKTLIWGRFNGDLPVAPVEPTEGSKMHKLYGGKSLATKNARSVTPEGFAYGFFMANNQIDNPLLALAGKYDRLDKGVLQKALDAGMSERDVGEVVDDFYFMDMDDESANEALSEEIAGRRAETEEIREGMSKAEVEAAFEALIKGEDSALEQGYLKLRKLNPEHRDALQDAFDAAAPFYVDAKGLLGVQAQQAVKRMEGDNAKKDIMDRMDGDLAGLQLANKEGTQFAFFLPDATEPGRYRASYFDAKGFYGHSTRDSYGRLLDEAFQDGYRAEVKGKLEELAGTDAFAKGNELVAKVQAVNAGRMQWKDFIDEQRAVAGKAAGVEKSGSKLTFTKDDNLPVGSIVEDGEGNQYRVHYQRNALVVTHPIVDGKAEVNSESSVRFHVGDPASADGRRTDPLYLVSKRESAAEPETSKPADKIEDFGETLLGARKFNTYAEKLKEAEELDVSAVPLSKSWPAPDYQDLIDGGADAWGVAFMRAARDEIPSKPTKGYKLSRWVAQVEQLREFAQQVATDPEFAKSVQALISTKYASLKGWIGRADLYAQFGHAVSLKGLKFEDHYYQFYKGQNNVSKWVVSGAPSKGGMSNWPREVAVGDTREEALAAFGKVHAKMIAAPESADAGPSVRFDIFTNRSTGEVFIAKKNGKRYAKMKTFSNIYEARDYLKASQKELEAQYEQMKVQPETRGSENAPRVGADYRNGQDVTPELFGESFGFRGVQFGNWVEDKRRQKDLNDAYDGLMDLAGILNIPARSLSLNGKLGLAFGARGKGGKDAGAAHYEPDQTVINLTKAFGAGSLAHEWWHALDNYFSKAQGQMGYLTEDGGARGNGVRPEMVAAFKELMKAVNLTGIKERSGKRDETRSKDYWSTGREMTARSFESYVIAKLADNGISSDYLANVVRGEAVERDELYPYPTAGEMPKIRAAYDNIFNAIEASPPDESGNVALFSLGASGASADGKFLDRGAVNQLAIKAVGENAATARFVFTSYAALPVEIREEAASQGVKPGEVKAVHWNGKTYMVDGRFTSAKEARQAIFHEHYVHFGLRAKYDAALAPKLRSLLDGVGGLDGVRELARTQGIDLSKYEKGTLGNKNIPESSQPLIILEELMAHMGHATGTLKRVIQEAIGAIRAWLRKSGYLDIAALGITDLANELKLARKAAQEVDQAGADGDVRFSFVGKKAATADQMKLTNAQAMLAKGVRAETVRRDTGWFVGVDGKWRFEIADNEARLIDAPITDSWETFFRKMERLQFGKNVSPSTMKVAEFNRYKQYRADREADYKRRNDPRDLQDLLNHPKLFAAYPDMATMQVFFADAADTGFHGVYYPGIDAITITKTADLEAMRSTLLHEIQHAIQHREGYATGGTSDASFANSVKEALKSGTESAKYFSDRWKRENSDKAWAAAKAAEIARYGLMYESATRLVNYANNDAPSGLFRNIRNEMQWIYDPRFRGNEQARDLQYAFYDIPKRHKIRERNAKIAQMALDASRLLMKEIPADLREQFKNDPRTMKGMLNALERESSKANKQLDPMRKLEDQERALGRVRDNARYAGAYEIYRALAGEVEARNTQKRLDMDDEQRKNTSIQSTADVDAADVIVMFGGMDVRAPTSMANMDAAAGKAKPKKQTETAAFKEWFGDSKVVDADGKPLVVYHGTGRKFSEFTPLWKQHLSMPWMDIKKGGRDHDYHQKAKQQPEMHFFSEDEGLAQSYADQFDDGQVMAVYLSVKNPAESSGRDTAIDEMLSDDKIDGAVFYDTDSRGLGRARSWVVRSSNQAKSAIGNNGNYDKTNPNINYRLNNKPASGIPLFSAQAIAKKLNDKLGVKVQAVANEAGLPQAVQDQIKRDKASGKVAGVYHGGKSYIIASNLFDTKHAIETVLHETIGHAGIKSLLGDKLGAVMQGIYRDMPKAMQAELKRKYADKVAGLNERDAQIEIAEEYVAHLAEHDPQNGLLDKLVAMIRQFIRNTFGEQAAGKWTRNDIVQLLAEAKKAARNNNGPQGGSRYRQGAEQYDAPELAEVTEASEAEFVASLKGQAVQSMAASLYKARGTDSPFFKNWFGKSKMVKDGKPVGFYHRSFGDMDSFDDARLGSSTGTATASLGHYLSIKDVGNVERYGPVADRFYVKMEKPKVISQAQFEAMGDWSIEQVKAYRAEQMKAGHDGLYIQGLGWPVVFEGKNIKGVRNQGTFDETDRTRYSVADVLQSIRRVIEAAKRKGHAPERADMGLAPEWLSRAAAKEGLIVEGFHHIIDGSAVRHILNRHGDAAIEASRGQLPVTAADIELIPQIIDSPDALVLGTKTNLGRDQIGYLKRLEDGTTLYLEELRTGRQALAAVSMRKYPAARNDGDIAASLISNAQSDGGHVPIIVRNPAAGNDSGIRYSLNGTSEALRRMAGRFNGRPLDRNDPYAEENRRLREDDKSLWHRAKKEFARQFAPGGLLPTEVFDEKIARDSEFQAVEFEVRHMSGRLADAVKNDYGTEIDALPEAQMRVLAEALSGRVDDSIPEATKVAIVAMRQYIDSLSGEYLSILQAQIEANMQGTDQSLIDKITGNLGAYVNRSYQAFDDPKWFKTVPTEVVNAAREYLANGYIAQGETAEEAARLADVTVNEMLKNGTAYDSMGAFIAESKLGAKDLSVLIKRKEIAPEIRALLGEYIDPRLNFAKSATKMGRLVWNQRFLDRVLDIGMGSFLFEGKNRPADATVQIAGETSDTYAPLNGLWTFPEVAQSFKDALGKEEMSELYRTIVRMNGMVKYGKTILSPTTAMRNWQSAMFFSLANGHFDLTQMKRSWSALREQVTQNATGDDLDYLHKLKKLGVVYDTPYAGEMMALLQDARMDELMSGKNSTGFKWLRKINQVAQGFYSFGDDFWKIIGYENEKAGLIKAGIPLEEAEKMAAKRIRNTYPTYSMIGKGVQWLRRFPLAGTFVSFPSEIIRTSVNMLRITAEDLKSDNPGIQAIGRKRAIGIAMTSAGFYALAAITAAAAGVDDDEEEALRDLAAPWSKNSTFLYLGRDDDGKLRYVDMSFLDPYGYWKRPLTAMMRNQPWEDSAASGLSDMLTPFFGTDITAGAIFEVMANKKPTGSQVYNENASSVDQLQDITNHMRKALQPGFVSNAERLLLAAGGERREGSGQPYDMRDEVVSLLGWRAATLDTKTGLYYRSFDFTGALTDARKTLTRTLKSSNDVSDGDINEARSAAEAQYQKAFTEMSRLVTAAQAAGMTKQEVARTLKLSGISQQNVFALLNGRVPKLDVNGGQNKAVQQARLMRDAEFAAELARRYRLARE